MNLPEVNENSIGFDKFLKILETVYNNGLINNDPFTWMNGLATEMENGVVERVFGYVRAVDDTRACRKVSTNLGRFRMLIRCCLKYQCVHVPVFVLVCLIMLLDFL